MYREKFSLSVSVAPTRLTFASARASDRTAFSSSNPFTPRLFRPFSRFRGFFRLLVMSSTIFQKQWYANAQYTPIHHHQDDLQDFHDYYRGCSYLYCLLMSRVVKLCFQIGPLASCSIHFKLAVQVKKHKRNENLYVRRWLTVLDRKCAKPLRQASSKTLREKLLCKVVLITSLICMTYR